MSQTFEKYFVPAPSLWPICGSIALLLLGSGASFWVNSLAAGPYMVAAGFAVLIYMLFGWFGQVARESEGGSYGKNVDRSFRWSMGWFIFSEVMFFAAFFGTLYYVREISVPDLASQLQQLIWDGFKGDWPSAGPYLSSKFLDMTYTGSAVLAIVLTIAAGAVITVAHHPLEHGKRGALLVSLGLTLALVVLLLVVMGVSYLPVVNTALLLASAVTLTWAHWAIRRGDRTQFNIFLALTILLGAVFMVCQAQEYMHAFHEGLTLKTGVYGAAFFMMTGFHGLHVTIGAIILTVVLCRSLAGHFSAERHFAFEAAAWYWHFVDYVWLLLFIVVYIL